LWKGTKRSPRLWSGSTGIPMSPVVCGTLRSPPTASSDGSLRTGAAERGRRPPLNDAVRCTPPRRRRSAAAARERWIGMRSEPSGGGARSYKRMPRLGIARSDRTRHTPGGRRDRRDLHPGDTQRGHSGPAPVLRRGQRPPLCQPRAASRRAGRACARLVRDLLRQGVCASPPGFETVCAPSRSGCNATPR
jgi:hypothetical protein